MTDKTMSEMSPFERINLIDGEFPFCIEILRVIGSFLADTDSSKWQTRHEESLSEMLSILYEKLAAVKVAVDLNNELFVELVRLHEPSKIHQKY